MKKINFLFGIHNHQPVGNFDSVFDESFNRCYLPFLEVLEKHPGIRISLHSSGPLWDYAMKKFPNYITMIQKLVGKKQIELLGGGYYEPLLSILPDRDAVGQIGMMNEFIKKTFGTDVRGIWLTERVWEPHIPEILAKVPVQYTIIDESHFRLAGKTDNHILGFYKTEKCGSSVDIFPINKNLRYYIPFKLPYETINLLREVASENPTCITYADDGEKFGIWPQTYKWVFEEKWLHNFFDEIEKNLSWINMPTFSEYLDSNSASGRIYLPTASYEEMMEWALPSEAACRYKKVIKEIDGMGKKEEYSAFIRGGIWSNFLAKYPESNQMYKRMLLVSSRLDELARKSENKREIELARTSLYKAQCNCAYWHGLFGGLYLNYLRHAIYSNIIEAENILDKVAHSGHKNWFEESRENLLDAPEKEIFIQTKNSNFVISPSNGASLAQFDYKPKSFNLSNVMSRHEESYHRGIKDLAANKRRGESGNEPKSIHDIQTIKDDKIVEKLVYDRYPKYSFMEHFFRPGTSMKDFIKGEAATITAEAVTPYAIESLSFINGRKNYQANFKKDVRPKDTGGTIEIRKSWNIEGNSPVISVEYTLVNKSQQASDFLFGVEFNLTMLAGNDEKRHYLIPDEGELNYYYNNDNRLTSVFEILNTKSLAMIDQWSKISVELSGNESGNIWVCPLETVSQSESGFELTYQGSTVVFAREISLGKSAEKQLKFTLALKEI